MRTKKKLDYPAMTRKGDRKMLKSKKGVPYPEPNPPRPFADGPDPFPGQVHSGRISLAHLQIDKGIRSLNKQKVDDLAESMEDIGLMQPVHVWEHGGKTHLVAGRHRVAAARKLGWEEIECIPVKMNKLDRQLWEIDENLMRADLTKLERADHTARRAKIIKARKKLSAMFADNSKRGPKDKGQTDFVEETAAATGKSKRSVETDKARGEKIAPDVKEAIKDTKSADRGVELDALSAMTHEEQRQAVERVQRGDSKNFVEAKAVITGEDNKDQKQFESLKRTWNSAGVKAREMFMDWVVE